MMMKKGFCFGLFCSCVFVVFVCFLFFLEIGILEGEESGRVKYDLNKEECSNGATHRRSK
jgi:hypothetical protein